MDFGENFNVADWINANIQSMMESKGYDEEKSASSLLTKLQISSRDESEIADQNIKLLTSGLPESMAKLSHIGSTVDDLSESLRNLTNSGYKFKSGNVSEKISELSLLKVKRDRLRESAEILNNGIRIEEDLKKLQDSCNTGNLKQVCEQYISVNKASKSLSSISRFVSINKQLRSIKQTIEDRLKHIMNSACSSMNDKVFLENAQLAQTITDADISLKVVTEFLTNKVKTFHSSYDNGDLQLSDWLSPCYDGALSVMIPFTDWCVSLSPSLFDKELRKKFIEIVANELNPAIRKQSITMLSEFKFDELVKINDIIENAWIRLTKTWKLSDSLHDTLNAGMVDVRASFTASFKKYLENILNPNKSKSLPKSSTTDTFKDPPSSPARSPSHSDGMLFSPISTAGFDKKLPENIKIAKNSLEWIKRLSTEMKQASLLSSSFLSKVIDAASSATIATLNKGESKTEADDMERVTSSIKAYKGIDKDAKKVSEFEEDVEKLIGMQPHDASESIKKMRDEISKQIVNSMSALSIRTLKNIHSSSEWSYVDEEEEEEEDAISMISTQQSVYMNIISKSFFNLLGLVTSDESIDKEITTSWIREMIDKISDAYIKEIVAIPLLSSSGQMQLKVDIQYFLSMLSSVGITQNPDLVSVLKVLNAPKKERAQELKKAGVSQLLQIALTRSLSLK